MSAVETFDLRKHHYFPGELVVTSTRLAETLSALARTVLFLRSVNASVTIMTPPRVATDDAFPQLAMRGGAAFGYDTPPRSANGSFTGGGGPAHGPSPIELRFEESQSAAVDAASIEAAVRELSGPAAAASLVWQVRPPLLSRIIATASSASSTPPPPSLHSQPILSSPSTPAVAPPVVPCAARLFVIKVAIESAPPRAAGAASWLGSLVAAGPTSEAVEEWCVPVVVVPPAEAMRLDRIVQSHRAVSEPSSSLFGAAALVAGAGGAGGGGGGVRGAGGGGVGVATASVARFGNASDDADGDLDDTVVISDAEAGELAGAGAGAAASVTVPATNTSVAAPIAVAATAIMTKESASVALRDRVAATSSPAVGSEYISATAASSAAPSASSSPARAANDGVDALCAMLEPDSAARLQLIAMWMQSTVLRPAAATSDSGGSADAQLFEGAPHLVVSVAATAMAPKDARLVEPRVAATAAAAATGAAGALAANTGVFKGFSLPRLWSVLFLCL